MNREFVAYCYFVGWECLSLGITIDVWSPNIEFHFPTGFIHIGWVMRKPNFHHWIFGYGT